MRVWGDQLSRMDQPILERLSQMLATSTPRWHRRADEPHQIVYVLDDGTGDIELRFIPEARTSADAYWFAVQLSSASRLVADTSLNLPIHEDKPKADSKLLAWLAQEIRLIGRRGEEAVPQRNHERFMVAFEPRQLESLRKLAQERKVPVAEVVRQAVARFLDQQEIAVPTNSKSTPQ